MEQSTAVVSPEPDVTGRIPGKKKILPDITGEKTENSSRHPHGLDKYFQVLPFVENFLDGADAQIKKDNGIFFTPYPVVSFIIRSVHAILKEKLDKPLGLAGGTVKILDPAAGTSTFLITVARLVIDELDRKYEKGKSQRLARQFLLNNLYGIEKEISLYAISSLKLAYFFQSSNLRLRADERFHLYWSNALENGTGNKRFNVIVGNPPYSGHSASKGQWISEKIKDYHPPKEKNLKWLQDDYVKFIRFGQEKIDENGEGVVGFITNNAYLDNPTFRAMRQSLMTSFDEIFILNLHGNIMKKEKCPDGSKDENVFDIRQGVAITFFVKKKIRGKGCEVFYSDIWGQRAEKYGFLDSHNFNSINWKPVYPEPDFFLFIPIHRTGRAKGKTCRYLKSFKITDIFPVHSVGIVTARDRLTIKKDKEEMYRTVKQFSGLDETAARSLFKLGNDSRDWKVREAQRDIMESGVDPEKVVPILYRPFDTRYTYYTGRSRGFLCMPRPAVMGHMLNENLGLITVRQVAEDEFNHCFVSETIVESRVTTSNRGICYVFPLYLIDGDQRTPNINEECLKSLADELGTITMPTGEQVFYYIYAILFSNAYREKYAVQLRFDFPLIPITRGIKFFNMMALLGENLVQIHLMKAPEVTMLYPRFKGIGDDIFNGVRFVEQLAEHGRFNPGSSDFFSDIPQELREYKLCGYSILKQILKNMKGRKITPADVEHFSRVMCVLDITVKYQEEIDRLYRHIDKE